MGFFIDIMRCMHIVQGYKKIIIGPNFGQQSVCFVS